MNINYSVTSVQCTRHIHWLRQTVSFPSHLHERVASLLSLISRPLSLSLTPSRRRRSFAVHEIGWWRKWDGNSEWSKSPHIDSSKPGLRDRTAQHCMARSCEYVCVCVSVYVFVDASWPELLSIWARYQVDDPHFLPAPLPMIHRQCPSACPSIANRSRVH